MPEHVDAGEKILLINRALSQEVVHRNLQQNDNFLALHHRLLEKLGRGAVEHVDVDVGDRPEASALNQYGPVVEDLGRLEHIARRSEHDGVSQAIFDEMEGENAVINMGKRWAAEFEHVDLHPVS